MSKNNDLELLATFFKKTKQESFKKLFKKNFNKTSFYINQIKIFIYAQEQKIDQEEKQVVNFCQTFSDNFFALNNAGNFYKFKKQNNKALKYFLLAEKNLNKSVSVNDKIKILTKNVKLKIKNPLIKKNDDLIKSLLNEIFVDTNMMLFITNSRPHFSESYYKYSNFKNDLSKFLTIKLNLANLIKLSNFLKSHTINSFPLADYDNIYFNIGQIYQNMKNLNEAIKYFKLANRYEKKNKYNFKLLECYYQKKEIKNFIKLSKKISKLKRLDFNCLAICNYASKQFGIKNNYSFCKDPLNNVVKYNLIDDKKIKKEFLTKLRKDIYLSNKQVKTPKVIGFKSLGNLYELKKYSILKCKKIINDYIINYKNQFKEKDSYLIKKWPENFSVNAWYIKLRKGGEVLPHIHDGWLSGVLYIRKSKKKHSKNKTDGELEVTYKFGELKEIKQNTFKKIFYVNQGDLILFPSSLPHRVIPYEDNSERLSIAFDMKPL